MDKREERPSELVITCGNATELFELVEESLDLLAPLVLFLIVMNRLSPVRPGGNHGFDALVGQRLANVLAVIRLVHDRSLRCGRAGQSLPQQLASHAIMALATRQHDGHTGSFVGTGDVQPGGEPTPGAAESLGLLATVFFTAPAAC